MREQRASQTAPRLGGNDKPHMQSRSPATPPRLRSILCALCTVVPRLAESTPLVMQTCLGFKMILRKMTASYGRRWENPGPAKNETRSGPEQVWKQACVQNVLERSASVCSKKKAAHSVPALSFRCLSQKRRFHQRLLLKQTQARLTRDRLGSLLLRDNPNLARSSDPVSQGCKE